MPEVVNAPEQVIWPPTIQEAPDSVECMVCSAVMGNEHPDRPHFGADGGMIICPACEEATELYEYPIEICSVCRGPMLHFAGVGAVSIVTSQRNSDGTLLRPRDRNDRGLLTCANCANLISARCNRCGQHILYHDTAEDSPIGECFNGENFFCLHCAQQERTANMINPYNYVPPRTTYCSGPWREVSNKADRDTPYFGVEFEIEFERSDSMEVLTAIQGSPVSGWSYLKSDGSLSNGFELVTNPMSWEFWRKHKDHFRLLFSQIRKMGCSSYDRGTCGIHIHISRKSFTRFHLRRFLEFFYSQANRRYLVMIAQRSNERYANMREDLDFVGRMSKSRYLSDKTCVRDVDNKYQAINTCKSSTVEIRIFRGSLRWATICKNIEFAHASFMFSRDHSFADMEDWGKFVEYLNKNVHRYKNLIEFLTSQEAQNEATSDGKGE